jgi:AraC-like DNA-binding protein
MKSCDKIISALESMFNCKVCFHDYDGRISAEIGKVPLFHRNTLCGIIQQSSKCFQYCCCMEAQDSRQHLMFFRQAFFKCCHAGLYELVVPVFYDTSITGVIFIGPFQSVDIPPENGSILCQQLHPGTVKMIAGELHKLSRLNQESAASISIFAELLSEQISATFAHGGKLSSDTPHDVKIAYFIDREFKNNLSLGDLACFLKVSKIRVCQLMRQHFDQTFSQILARRRFEHARYLLKNSRLKISTIASDCGFNDPLYFFRMFKRYTHMTPGQYRKQFQIENMSPSNLQG